MSPTSLVAQFRARHTGGSLLVLANAWDAGSARLMASLGAEAVATTSSGVAWAHGYPDGDALPIAVHAEAVRQIARVLTVPLSIDAEGGYAEGPAAVRDNLARLIDAGAVGFNLEDGAATPDAFARKIEAARAAGSGAGVEVFVNARTDVFLRGLAPGREVAETLGRARLYAGAGADGLFVPGAVAASDIAQLVQGQPLPLNVMAWPGLPAPAELAVLGVRRLSAGGAITQACWALAGRLGATFLSQGVTPALFADAAGYAELNTLMR
jgi:2-methylisocitrate lyase-like PEP mutase family enzyme